MSKLNPKDLSLKEENKDDFKLSVIERKNLTNQFTINDIENHLKTLHRLENEVGGTVRLAKATMRNIEENHQKLLDKLSEEERHHVWMWYDQKGIVDEGDPKLKEIKKEIKKHNEYLDVIYDAFGFVKSNLDDKNNKKRPPKDWGPDALRKSA